MARGLINGKKKAAYLTFQNQVSNENTDIPRAARVPRLLSKPLQKTEVQVNIKIPNIM